MDAENMTHKSTLGGHAHITPDIELTCVQDCKRQEEAGVDKDDVNLDTGPLSSPATEGSNTGSQSLPMRLHPDSVGPNRKKSTNRRSSVVRGRQSAATLIPLTSKELCRTVSMELSPDERFSKLTISSFEHTLLELCNAMPNLSGMQQFHVEVREKVLKVVEQRKQEGFFKEATQGNKYKPNSENMKLDQAIEDCKKNISRLKEEAEKWNNLVLQKQEFADKTLRIKDEQMVMTDPPPGLSEQHQKHLEERPLLNVAVDRLRRLKESTVLAADEVVRKVKYLEKFRTTAEQHINTRNSDLYKHSGMQSFASPRKLIIASVLDR